MASPLKLRNHTTLQHVYGSQLTVAPWTLTITKILCLTFIIFEDELLSGRWEGRGGKGRGGEGKREGEGRGGEGKREGEGEGVVKLSN